MTRLNQLEPDGLIAAFCAHPPSGFAKADLATEAPAFHTRFDLLTTASASLRSRVRVLPFYRHWGAVLRPRTLFVGTTVSEYALFNESVSPSRLIAILKNDVAPRYPILIIRDIPQRSPLLGSLDNDFADAVVKEAVGAGFVVVEGQALAYVPIDFDSIDAYLSRLSASRRKNIRRKLRARADVDVEVLATGAACFNDEDFRAELYGLYLNVYQQSDLKFDLLSARFFSSLFRAPHDGGLVFIYRHHGELIGFNLCYIHERRLVDKYIGLAYPQAKRLNLYFVSWFINLEYALSHGLDAYVAGWTDPQVKLELGARFTYTRHAVYVRNWLLRVILRLVATQFEPDRDWRDVAKPHHS